jgi:hypothetical protein
MANRDKNDYRIAIPAEVRDRVIEALRQDDFSTLDSLTIEERVLATLYLQRLLLAVDPDDYS